MAPPSIRTLLLLNVAVQFVGMLVLSVANQVWTAAGWGASDIGAIMTVTCLAYAAPVALGGYLADHWGRARTGVLGLGIIVAGVLPALIHPTPWLAACATTVAFFGAAFFYPGCAGLFSDAEGASAGAPMPLHVKVSRYCLGWSGGALLAFAIAAAIAGLDPRIGLALSEAAGLAGLLTLLRWLNLSPAPPAAQGDRAPHPALPVLILMCRSALLLACMVGMGFISLLERALLAADPQRAHLVACLSWTCYSAGYVGMFLVFGRWNGWIFAPWRPWLLQLSLLVGSAGVFAIGWFSLPTMLLAGCGLLLGIGYGSAYVGSLYYSLRRPHGAARAASLHETFIGVGNTASPLIGAVALPLLASGQLVAPWPHGPSHAVMDPKMPELAALGVYCAACGVACLLLQVVMIPIAERRAGSLTPPVAAA